ncbi:pyridoxamine 5'-phosphate oxidase family protein [Paracoccus laeviglucosivorans]|uniref:General stress protein 26 n=1 Tax=Paracoccus laeviglucosivorans TaxID=1197861 RepID=A0A521AGP7_9RHOB|nr:pyridoxamine 5'-phosphate oxidase family protein [Paracoccus laeviglucosivorans]SMO33976.1 General stress protein 26 [Paracoccus laeviglucosivorans]
MTDQQTFWKRLDGINAGMLGSTQHLNFVPMSHYADPDQGALWFITAHGTDLEKLATAGPYDAMHIVGDASGKLWARIEGQIELSDDREKLDEIWGAVASAWFEDGEQDSDVRLLKFTLTGAEVWSTTGGLGFLYQVAKANITGAKPDIGEHFTLSF